MAGRIYIGTSGWAYASWTKSFYPQDLPLARQLAFYATWFPTVEINATFYRLPEASTFAAWREQAPRGFRYAVKGSRTVTHFFKLAPGAKSFELLLHRSRALGPRLGPYLWQLPAGFRKDVARLEAFVATLPKRSLHAIELRDPSWLDEEVFAVLRRAKVANVATSSLDMPPNRVVTARFVYVRFHGLRRGAAHDYADRELLPWAEWLRACARGGLDGYVYFNNDADERAPYNALRLMELVGTAAVGPEKTTSAAIRDLLRAG